MESVWVRPKMVLLSSIYCTFKYCFKSVLLPLPKFVNAINKLKLKEEESRVKTETSEIIWRTLSSSSLLVMTDRALIETALILVGFWKTSPEIWRHFLKSDTPLENLTCSSPDESSNRAMLSADPTCYMFDERQIIYSGSRLMWSLWDIKKLNVLIGKKLSMITLSGTHST